MPTLRLSPVFAALAISWVAANASPALAAPATYNGVSSDGSVAVFSTKEQMVPGDTDQEVDVYVRAFDSDLGEYVTREVSIGPAGGNDTLPATYDGVSADGAEVFFSTREAMVAADTDHKEDVYVRNVTENKTFLASEGDESCAAQNCGNGEVDTNFVPGGVAPAGDAVFFATTEGLVDGDEDSSIDIYLRDVEAETTMLVSAGDASCSGSGCGNGPNGAVFRGTDETGGQAFFTTFESLNSQDEDSAADIYARDLVAETTSLVSVPGACPPELPPGQNCEPSYGGASPDGAHVFFETNERLSGADTDSSQDVYDWSGGAPALASQGGNGEFIVTYAGTSGDGATVYFLSSEKLDPTEDSDSAQDVYRRSGGVTALVSAGESGKGNGPELASFSWASTAAGPQVAIFRSGESLTSDDEDGSQDVYKRSGGVTSLISLGPTGGKGDLDANFAGASTDGSRIFFVTTEPLVAADTDSSLDVYRRTGTETVLVSAGQINGNGAFTAGLHGVSSDGSRAFFVTQERLTEGDDFAGETDVYSWTEPSKTLLVSVNNSPDLELGPPPPTLEKTVPASPNPSTTPTIVGVATSGALVKVYKTFDCSGEPVAEGTAEELTSPGLTVTVPVALGSTTSFRATAEAEGIVSVCSSSISYKQEEAPPPPPPPPPGEEGTGGGGGTGGTGGKTPGGENHGITYVTPLARITYAPAARTRLRRPTFRFADLTEQPGTKFFCRVDKLKWASCTSPIKLKRLKLGRHAFSVKAVNAVGTPGPNPVKRAFKVVR